MTRNKLNIGIAVATGLLIGFVFGACFGPSESSLNTNGNTSGNASLLSVHKIKKAKFSKDQVWSADTEKDTLKFTMTDEQGNTWNVTMNK